MAESDKVGKVIDFAVSSPDIPHLYANGFISALGNGDTLLVLQQNGRPVASLNLSFTLAKTLSESLADIIKDLEKKSDNVIMTTKDLDKILVKNLKKG